DEGHALFHAIEGEAGAVAVDADETDLVITTFRADAKAHRGILRRSGGRSRHRGQSRKRDLTRHAPVRDGERNGIAVRERPGGARRAAVSWRGEEDRREHERTHLQ